MKGYELIEKITNNEIVDNTKIAVYWEDVLITTLEVKNKGLIWESGMFTTSQLCEKTYNFEIIEDKPKFEVDEKGFIHTNSGAWKGRKIDIEFAKTLNWLIEKSSSND